MPFFLKNFFKNLLQQTAFYGTILIDTKITKGAQSVNKSASPQPKKTKRIDGEALIAIFLLALTVFLVFTVSILIFRACSIEKVPPVGGSVTTPPIGQITPPQNNSAAIFSGGMVIPYAISDANTKSIADEIDSFYAILIILT